MKLTNVLARGFLLVILPLLALLVGVRAYDRPNHFPTLWYTENDVEKLAALLKRPAGDCPATVDGGFVMHW